jgi:hypothetical protein
VAVAQIHEFEKRVGLFGFEVQVAKLVHRQDIVAPETKIIASAGTGMGHQAERARIILSTASLAG